MVKTKKPKQKKTSAGSAASARATAAAGTIRIQRIAVAKIKTAPYNPRKDLKPDDPEYERIKRSLDRFGLVEPLVWNKRSGNLVGGHQRLKIMVAERGVTAVDVSVVDLLPAEEKTLNLALNKVSGAWDESKLAGVLRDLQAVEELDADISGFDEEERNLILQAQAAGEPDADESGGNGARIAEVYGVVAECRNEMQQKKLFYELKGKGYKVTLKTA